MGVVICSWLISEETPGEKHECSETRRNKWYYFMRMKWSKKVWAVSVKRVGVVGFGNIFFSSQNSWLFLSIMSKQKKFSLWRNLFLDRKWFSALLQGQQLYCRVPGLSVWFLGRNQTIFPAEDDLFTGDFEILLKGFTIRPAPPIRRATRTAARRRQANHQFLACSPNTESTAPRGGGWGWPALQTRIFGMGCSWRNCSWRIKSSKLHLNNYHLVRVFGLSVNRNHSLVYVSNYTITHTVMVKVLSR